MEKKKNRNWFNKLMFLLFIIFLCLYTVSLNGYSNRNNEYKSLYTKEMIEKFEKDIENGENIDINNYFTYEEKNYSNKISKLGEKFSEGIDFASNKSLEMFSNFFAYLFE